MKKQIITGIVIFSLLAIACQAAHFVCGTVFDAADSTTAIGMNVMLYYPADSTNKAECSVNGENIYCCDAEAIPGHTWQSGDVVHSRLSDRDYVGGPVNTTTTAAGYDVAPDMNATLAIHVFSPSNNSIIRSNHALLDITTASQMNQSIWCSLNYSANTTLCTRCNNATTNITLLDEGTYTVIAYANNTFKETKSEQITFTIDAVNDPPILNSYSPESIAPSMDELDTLEFSVNATDPNNYSVVSYYWTENGNALGVVNSSYEFISWYNDEHSAGVYNITVNITDGEFSVIRSWLLTVSDVSSQGASNRENYVAREIESDYKESKETFALNDVKINEAVVIRVNDNDFAITRLEIEVKENAPSLDIEIAKLTGRPEWLEYDNNKNAYQFLEIKKSVDDKVIRKATFYFKVEKSWLKDYDAVFVDIYNGKWERLTPEKISEDDKYVHYGVHASHLSIVVIAGKKAGNLKESAGEENVAVNEVAKETPGKIKKTKETTPVYLIALTAMAVSVIAIISYQRILKKKSES
ncbi:PGF-pre-PGF domain-containing protein [Candidatus Woesearchaeota archaeon]|nr:PGF-pre-PGF domain-containing protein [Candidatus Woesearchaeota archaeon]